MNLKVRLSFENKLVVNVVKDVGGLELFKGRVFGEKLIDKGALIFPIIVTVSTTKGYRINLVESQSLIVGNILERNYRKEVTDFFEFFILFTLEEHDV